MWNNRGPKEDDLRQGGGGSTKAVYVHAFRSKKTRLLQSLEKRWEEGIASVSAQNKRTPATDILWEFGSKPEKFS